MTQLHARLTWLAGYALMAALYAVAELAAMKEKRTSVYEDRDLLVAG